MRVSFLIFVVFVFVFVLTKFVGEAPQTNLVSREIETVKCRELIQDLTIKKGASNSKDLDYRSWVNLGDCYAHFSRYEEALTAFKNAYKLKSSTELQEFIASLEKHISKKVTTEERHRSFYTLMRDFGPATRLTGKTVVVYLFVETNQSQWSSLDRQQAISTLEFAQQWYMNQAKHYQLAEPTFVNRAFYIGGDPILSRFHKTLSIRSPQNEFVRYVISKLGFDSLSQFLKTAKLKEQADNAMVILHLNKEARSFAYPCTYKWCEEEYTFILQPVKNPMWQHSLHYTVAHEGLHLFGADDLYNIRNASNYAPNDIMHHASRYLEDSEINDLTAYAIGWTNFKPYTPFPIY